MSSITVPTSAKACPTCSGRISDDVEPTASELREARRINLTLAPASEAAHAVAAEVAAATIAHEGRERIGSKSRSTIAGQTAAIVGGLLKEALSGRRVVSAQRRPGGGMWEGALIGHHAFWARTEAMEKGGLVRIKTGVKTAEDWGDGGLWFGGIPTKIWPAPRLMAIAARHGVVAETLKTDWRISEAAETQRIAVAPSDLILCKSATDKRKRTALAADQMAEAEKLREWTADLNERVAAADIRGCRAPAFRRTFLGDLRLGGRLYALGNGSYQGMSKEERASITINGIPVAEVDLNAAHLTIFLGLTGTRALPEGDLYERLGDLSRDAIKAWFVQTFGAGKLTTRWARGAKDAVLGVSPKLIRDAALRTYPALRDLLAILPPDLRAALPAERLGWAVGQYLVNVESRIIVGALRYLANFNVVGLPVHDSVIVPKGAVGRAVEGLHGASSAFAKIVPRVAW